jgi:hypothetical protein
MHDLTKVVRVDNKNTDVVEWTKVVRKKCVRKRRTPDQPTDGIRQSVSQSCNMQINFFYPRYYSSPAFLAQEQLR